MELNERKRHASEVRWWVARILEQSPSDRRAYWLHWRSKIAARRGADAAQRVHDGVLKSWRA